MLPSPVRAGACATLAGLLAGLLAAVLVPLVVTAPAQASAGCTSERPGVLGLSCDDENAPDTTAASGSQTAAGQVTVSATGAYSDGDHDPIGFQCQVVGTAPWGPCTISNLSPGDPRIAIRAVDTADLALDTPCDDLLCTVPEVPDFDTSPAVVTVHVTGGTGGGGTVPPPPGPGGAPETQITRGPRDRLTPGEPVSLVRRPVFELTASEPATFNCAVNATKVPCQAGLTVLKKLEPGVQVFVAQAQDRDGHFDTTPATLTFYVPHDLAPGQGKGWKNVKSHGSYANDYVTTGQKGAVLSVGRVQAVREIRLLAPAGPRLGKVAVRVGNGPWLKVRLRATESQKLRVYELRRPDARPLSGAVQVKALAVPAGGAVAVDAIVAR
jgi:hypothetical protein